MIKLSRAYRESPETAFEKKLTVFANLHVWLDDEKLFKHKKLELWQDASSEAEDGKLLYEYSIDPGIKPMGVKNLIASVAKKYQAHRLIVILEGDFMGDPAYLALFNIPTLSEIYGDIVFNVYDSIIKRREGLYDYILEDPKLYEKFLNIAIQIGKTTPKPRFIAEGFSPDLAWNFTERVFFYSANKKSIILDIFRTIRKLFEFGKECELPLGTRELSKLANNILPYKDEFFASSILELREAEKRLKEIAKVAEARVDIHSSSLFVGYQKDSATRFFHEFITEILKPIISELHDAEYIRGLIRRVITKTKTLD